MQFLGVLGSARTLGQSAEEWATDVVFAPSL